MIIKRNGNDSESEFFNDQKYTFLSGKTLQFVLESPILLLLLYDLIARPG